MFHLIQQLFTVSGIKKTVFDRPFWAAHKKTTILGLAITSYSVCGTF